MSVSRESPSSETMAYRVPMEGTARPNSTCDMKLAEIPTLRESSLREIFDFVLAALS